jgi:biopolymer transport protein ExbB
VEQETAQVARRLAGNGPEAVSSLPMYVYEDTDELAEVSEGQSLAETIEGGGIIGIVILSIGAVSVLLIILRSIFLSRVGRSDAKRVEETFVSVKQGNLEKALSSARKVPGAMGRVLSATVHGLQVDPENIEDVISESVLNEQPALDRFRSALSVFAAVAPLLGLLGTVTGMISTFDVITQYGTGDPQLLSGGISEALITTELGLAVAIPTLLIGNLLASWGDRITSNLEVTALRAVNISGGYEGAA